MFLKISTVDLKLTCEKYENNLAKFFDKKIQRDDCHCFHYTNFNYNFKLPETLYDVYS